MSRDIYLMSEATAFPDDYYFPKNYSDVFRGDYTLNSPLKIGSLKTMVDKEHVDLQYIILWFMLSVYPALAIPNHIFYPARFFFENADYEIKLGVFAGPRFIFLAVISITALIVVLTKKVRLNHLAFIPLAVFLTISFVSSMHAQSVPVALIGSPYRFTGFSTYFFCAILFVLAFSSSKTKDHLTYMIGCATVISLIAIFQYYGMDILSIKRSGNSYGTLGHRNYLGTYTVFVLPAAILFFLRQKKLVWLICSAVIYAGLLVSLTRGSWLAFLVASIIIVIYYVKNSQSRKNLISVFLVLLLVTLILLPSNSGALSNRIFSVPHEMVSAAEFNENAGTQRMYIWKEVMKKFPEYWVLGVGPDNLGYLGIELPGNLDDVDKAHNIFIEIGITMGIFALLAYIIFLIFFLLSWKNEDGFLFFVMVITYLVQGMFNIDVVMVMPLFWVVLGFSLASRQNNSSV